MNDSLGLPENCPHCAGPVQFVHRHCPHCDAQLEAPNVRAARREQSSLAQRHADALAKHPDKVLQFARFMDAVNQDTTAVIARSPDECWRLASSTEQLYASFYQLASAGVRMPSLSLCDEIRTSVDERLFPYYKDHILMAALSADGWGLTHYGDCHLEIKPEMMETRSSVFEQNSLLFITDILELRHGKAIPAGHRALWEERGKLAVVKHQDELDADTSPAHYPALLLSSGVQAGKDERFIEVHIYGSLSMLSVAAVRLMPSVDPFHLKRLREKLAPRNDILVEQKAA